MARQEALANPVAPDPKARPVLQETTAAMESQVRKVRPANRVPLEAKVPTVTPDHLDPQDQLARKPTTASPVKTEPLDHRVHQARPVTKATTTLPASQAHLVHRDPLARTRNTARARHAPVDELEPPRTNPIINCLNMNFLLLPLLTCSKLPGVRNVLVL